MRIPEIVDGQGISSLHSRKRIVFLASHLLAPSVASGGDVLFCEIARRIRARRPDWEIIVIAPDFAKDGLSKFFERVVTIRTRPDEGHQGSPANVALTWLRRVRITTKMLIELAPDIVHSTGDFFVDTWPVVLARRHCTFRWSGVVHHINAPPFRRRNDILVSAISYGLQRISLAVLRRADAVSVLNQSVRKELLSLDFLPKRVHIVGAGIDIDRFPLISGDARQPCVAWVNRMEPTKGIFDLPAIVQALPQDVVVDVVGRGPEVHVKKLRDLLQEYGVQRQCVLHGFVSNEDLQKILDNAAVFISCSYEEGWGISIAEALSMGIPCVTYDLPSHREIFGDAIASVPIGDTAAFAAAVTMQLRRDENMNDRVARHELARRYSWDACALRQEESFETLQSDKT